MNRLNIIDSYNEIDEENRLQSTNARKIEFLSTVKPQTLPIIETNKTAN